MNIIIGEIRVKRGNKANLPVLKPGEPAFCEDTKEYVVGSPTGNIFFPAAGSSSGGGDTGGGSGSGVLVYNTLAELQTAYPGGTNQPVWIEGEKSWFYWEGTVTPPADTTAPVLTITAGGTFTGTKTVSMTADETADIFYTLDGSTPTTASTKYTAPLSISATTTLKALARDTAGNQSVVQTVTYTLDTTAPADTTAPDNVTNLQATPTANSVSLSWTASASSDVASYDIYNGSTLIANVTGTSYNVTNLNASTQYTFSVRAKDGANNVASGTNVTTTTLAPADTTAPVLTITPAATFTDTQTVNMSTNETATIWYTLDDSDPTTSGTRLQYTSPLTLTETDTIKAYAVDTAGNASAVQTVTYTKQTATASYVNDGSLTYIQTTQSNEFTVPNSENYFNGTGQFTFFSTVDMNSNMYWIRRENEADTNFRITVKLNTSNQMSATLRGKTSTNTDSWITISASTSTVVDINSYAHLVLMRDATNIKLYINNVLVAQSANVASTVSTTDSTGVKPLRIGEGTNTIFKNAGYYNRALTAEELTQNYNALK